MPLLDHVNHTLLARFVLIKLGLRGAPLIPLIFTAVYLMVTEYYSIFDTTILETLCLKKTLIINNLVDLLFYTFHIMPQICF